MNSVLALQALPVDNVDEAADDSLVPESPMRSGISSLICTLK